MNFIYREHAFQRMFERDIFEEEVEQTVKKGEIIEEYLDDKTYTYKDKWSDNDKTRMKNEMYDL